MEAVTQERPVITFPNSFKNLITASEARQATPVEITRRLHSGWSKEFEYFIESCGLSKSRASTLASYKLLFASLLSNHQAPYLTFPRSGRSFTQQGVIPSQVTAFLGGAVKAGFLKQVWKQNQPYLRQRKKLSVYEMTPLMIHTFDHMFTN